MALRSTWFVKSNTLSGRTRQNSRTSLPLGAAHRVEGNPRNGAVLFEHPLRVEVVVRRPDSSKVREGYSCFSCCFCEGASRDHTRYSHSAKESGLAISLSQPIHFMYSFSLSHLVHDPVNPPAESTMLSMGQCGGSMARPSRQRYLRYRFKAFCEVPNRCRPLNRHVANLIERLSAIL